MPVRMLGFDIETTGLIRDIPKAEISVLCTIDSETMEEKVYNFMLADDAGKARLRQEMLTAFNQAESLCAYNAVLFDIPFMQIQLHLDDETVHAWLLKLCDPFHAIKTTFNFTCKLDVMLALNGLDCKSATGLQAIDMAKSGDWEGLVSYCMDDVRLTVQLCQREEIVLFQHMDGFFVCASFAYCKPTGLGFWTRASNPHKPAAVSVPADVPIVV